MRPKPRGEKESDLEVSEKGRGEGGPAGRMGGRAGKEEKGRMRILAPGGSRWAGPEP